MIKNINKKSPDEIIKFHKKGYNMKMFLSVLLLLSAFVSLSAFSKTSAKVRSANGCASAQCPKGTTCRPDGDTYECVSNTLKTVKNGCASAQCPKGTTCRPDGDTYECVSIKD